MWLSLVSSIRNVKILNGTYITLHARSKVLDTITYSNAVITQQDTNDELQLGLLAKLLEFLVHSPFQKKSWLSHLNPTELHRHTVYLFCYHLLTKPLNVSLTPSKCNCFRLFNRYTKPIVVYSKVPFQYH